MTFNRPQTGGGDVFKPAEHANELVLVWPRDMRYNVTTPTGVSDAMACDVVVLDGPGAGAKFVNTLLFSAGLRNNLQSYLGDANPALGRIINVQLAGGKTTWNLADFTDQDAANASAYLQAFPHNPAPVQQHQPAPQQGNQWAPAPEAARPQQTQEQAVAAFRGDPALAAPAAVQANTWAEPAANQWAQAPAAQPAAAAPPAWAAPAAAPAAAPPAQYQPPVAVNQGTGEVAAPQAAPAGAAAWSAVDVQNCLRQGLDDATIAATTGAPIQAVAAIRAAGPQ
ncbi:hypothetical protein [Arthrobacter sp. UYCu712]|uniref:hypothetical protein n=1 Tax=Arthrobacter sp. UYCu712 TaxID=3156340 RepID=UPI0033971967